MSQKMHSFKMDTSGGISIYMYVYPDLKKVEFVWTPKPPYSTNQNKEIDSRFLPWVTNSLASIGYK